MSPTSLEWEGGCGWWKLGCLRGWILCLSDIPAWIPPRQPAKDLAAADTASRGHRREMLDLLPQVVLLSDGGLEVGTHTHKGRHMEIDIDGEMGGQKEQHGEKKRGRER